jgi:hypothetical protein
MNQLIPRLPKRKRQPTADCMREQLALAADEIIRLKSELDQRHPFDLFFGARELGCSGSSPVGGYIDPNSIRGPRPSWWERLTRKVA